MREGPGRVAFVTLGCKVNQAESETIAEALGDPGLCRPEDAEVVVINTCTVTGEADRKARKAVRHALGLAGSPKVLVTGCLAALDADGLRALGDRVVVEADKARVASAVGALITDASHREPCDSAPIRPARSRVQLKVQDGCDVYCTYCIVPYARGVPRAVPLEAVVERAERLVRAGLSEIVLTGINIGRYDYDGARLPDLLEAVAATGVPRVRMSSVEPGDVGDRLLEVAARTAAFCPHLHLPLQSGSDSVLARMGRPYDTAIFAETVARAREALPGIAVSTDIIAGFPGESDAEAAETLTFVEAQGFSRLHVFRYSARTGTPAAGMAGAVAPTVRAARAAALRALGDRLGTEYARSRIGTRAEILVEGSQDAATGAPSEARGTTREYLRAVVPDAAVRPGTLLDTRVEAIGTDGSLICRLAR